MGINSVSGLSTRGFNSNRAMPTAVAVSTFYFYKMHSEAQETLWCPSWAIRCSSICFDTSLDARGRTCIVE